MSRVLFSACDGYGHAYPLVPLATALWRLGHEVVIATGPDLAPVVQRHGLQARAVGTSLADAERAFLRRHPDASSLEPETRLAFVTAEMFVRIAAGQRAPGLVELIEEWRPHLVVHDASEFAAPIAAARAGLPAIAHGVSLLNPTPQLAAAVQPRLDELGAEWGVERATERLLRQPYLDICPPSLAGAARNPFADVRPLRPQLPSDPEATLPAALRALPYDRTVLVTLGTMVHRTPGVLETSVAAVNDLPVNLVVTVGPDGDLDRLGRQPRHVHVARYLPFEALIPQSAALVAHAGAGTLLGSLAAGVPSVLVPQGAEQIANALAAERAGAAVTLLPGTVVPAAVRAALLEVLDDDHARKGAVALAAEIATLPSAPQLAAQLVRATRLVPA